MKALHILPFFALILFSNAATGQRQSQVSAGIDLGSGFNSTSWAPSILYHEEISPNNVPWLRFGLGLRAWGYYAGRTNLYSKKSDSDYLEYDHVSANGVSFVAGVNLRFWRIDLGVNTDLIGASLGSRRRGYYDKLVGNGTGRPNYGQWLSTSPVILNLVPLALKNYNGQSEVYARIFLTKRFGLKLGYVHGQIAYHTRERNNTKVLLDNSQRRAYNFYGLPYAAVSFPIY
ncbi:hypothetical protein DYBT9623_05068 [Dyadobacter sp. CECT 9623]|uniref:Outer membrane protein beta-barrel domain-containing protein n=1 Tax=Dyadobacter linearis TaxID=2823330 RepID=A0ABM8UXQ4_9BACT|nr:hypothetical protein [Dyadobacter sp. CECT 9623]CAG5074375.1 hypothetical protein DYBT9623_05068 [Dyadobacter sp. CECT 9623]